MPDEWVAGNDYDRWYASLPNAVGTFTGYFDEPVAEQLFGPPPELIVVELDTHDQPSPAAGLPDGAILSFTIGSRRWQFTVHHSVHLAGNRWEIWCYRDRIQEVADGQGP